MPVRYYAMLGEEQVGPLTLEELVDMGLRPDTYVWCKGMPDWERADENADICRCYRQRLSQLRHPAPVAEPLPEPVAPEAPEEDDYDAVPPAFRYMARRSGMPAPEKADHDPADHDPSTPPPSGMLSVAVLVTVVCFPLTGIAAVYFAYKARRYWEESQRSESKSSSRLYSEEERRRLQTDMADAVRQCKMWTGITVALGLMVYGAMIHLL